MHVRDDQTEVVDRLELAAKALLCARNVPGGIMIFSASVVNSQMKEKLFLPNQKQSIQVE